MSLTYREFWLMVHLGLGVLFLHAFIEGVHWLQAGAYRRRLTLSTVTMAIIAWLTVISGTWLVYPWYRATPSPRSMTLEAFPQAYLEADPALQSWHAFGMEWKEHVGWLAPILATAVAWIVVRYGRQLPQEPRLRQVLLVLFITAFTSAVIAAGLGAFINKVAPNTFLDY
jgi:hypothetical protein